MTFELMDATLRCGGSTLVSGLSLIASGGQLLFVSVGRGAAEPLLRAMQGIVPLSEGVVSIGGEPLTERSCGFLRRLMGYVPRAVRQPDDDAHPLTPAEQRRLMFGEVMAARKAVVLVDGLLSDEERAVCQQMAHEGTAVVVVQENEIN